MNKPPRVLKQTSSPAFYTLPSKFFLNSPDRPDQLSAGDREALSAMIAAFTFSPRIYDLMRFVAALNSTIQAYLVKRNRYSEYTHIFQEITQHIANARILLDSPTDHGRAATILYSLETALKVIAEREGLTQTGASMYDGKMPIAPVSDGNSPSEGDPYGI